MRDRLDLPGGLRLRPWQPSDVRAVLGAFEEPVMQRQADAPLTSTEAAEQWLCRRRKQWLDGAAYSFAVTDGEDMALGGATVSNLNLEHSTGWISYWTTSAARGRRVASQGCRALVEWCFAELALFRLELGHRTDNPASCRVALAAGFAVEGLQRGKLVYDGVRHDVETHARLATDTPPREAPGPHRGPGP
ncbi:GNAT family protein [Streptomyces sp. DSM 42041]|uniref:GNAT family protein n=1 Tax=Streptomyces hazeniae TaxID=3075538 RepID=A0ABU2NNN9_9ACTN|nr:GNAT family protein [Streptomyces sp. DSM 42041]MDT0377813.1 GNAT family protein [Streptomyces sp. DSM 42041]